MKHGVPHPIPTSDERSLFTLVENRIGFTMEQCELNVFETHRQAEKVNLVFSDTVLTSMLRGKKVMHLFGQPGFDYLPGESVIVPPHELMKIDFPEANAGNPTQCIALAISSDQIIQTINLLNEKHPKVQDPWKIDQNIFHLNNSRELSDTINRLIHISIKEHHREKDLLANLALKELLIRLMQTQARHLFETHSLKLSSSHRFAFVIQFIRENIREKIELGKLADKICMSRANFFRKFKQELGFSPGDYILRERLRLAKEYLLQPRYNVTDVCFMAGFQNVNYFIRAFKKETGLTPSAFRSAQSAG